MARSDFTKKADLKNPARITEVLNGWTIKPAAFADCYSCVKLNASGTTIIGFQTGFWTLQAARDYALADGVYPDDDQESE